jgi:hypothetical protein
MSNAKWTRTTYQAPTEITRSGITWYFKMSTQEIQKYGKSKIIKALKKDKTNYRFIWNTRNNEYELWIR